MLLHEVVQIDVHLRGVLVDEVETLGLGPLCVDGLRGVEDEGHVFVALTNLAQQLQTGLGVALFDVAQTSRHRFHGETGVGDDTKGVLVILLVECHRLLVVRGQHHLGTATFALGGSVGVQGLGRETLRLREDIVIEVRQHRGVEADVILDEQNHLHAGLADVVVDVHLVLQQLDDGHDEVRVAEPAEDIVEDGHVLVLNALGDAVREGCQHHAGNVRVGGLDLAGHGEGIVVGITRHTDNQVDVGGFQYGTGLLGR